MGSKRNDASDKPISTRIKSSRISRYICAHLCTYTSTSVLCLTTVWFFADSGEDEGEQPSEQVQDGSEQVDVGEPARILEAVPEVDISASECYDQVMYCSSATGLDSAVAYNVNMAARAVCPTTYPEEEAARGKNQIKHVHICAHTCSNV